MNTTLVRRGVALGVCLGMLCVGLLAAGVRPAGAHASIVKSSIAPGAVLHSLPATLSATFAEGVNPKGSFIGVFETRGDYAEVDKENSMVSFSNAKMMTVGLPKKLDKGTYRIIWFTISADDGHKAGGAFTFTVK